MEYRRGGSASGVFLLNSNAMDFYVSGGSSASSNFVEFRAIGGIIDMYILIGPTPHDVVMQYQEVVGKPYFIPRWALGWHQCRYGYKSVYETEQVVEKYRQHQIPVCVFLKTNFLQLFKNIFFFLIA